MGVEVMGVPSSVRIFGVATSTTKELKPMPNPIILKAIIAKTFAPVRRQLTYFQ